LTFASETLYECLLRVLVYMARTCSLGLNFNAKGEGAHHLKAFADSNWNVTRSVTGFVIMLAGACICHASRRQHCITMSTCEAELVALADLAIELIHMRSVLSFIGYEIDGTTEVCTDSKAAYDLCHR
jgi:hypothetical protein